MENLLQDLLIDNALVEDEIDQVFNTLPQVNPPATLVDSIMSAVAHMPLPQVSSSATLWQDLELLNVSLDLQRLC